MTFELNPGQKAAAECLDRPVLVTAGAGSGKTRMLTQRFVNAVVPRQVSGWSSAGIDEIVAITFTDKAAGEIAERVRLALRAAGRSDDAREVNSAWISTIHGLCSRILRRHPFEAGVDPLFTVGDAVQVGRLREEAFEEAARRVLEASKEGAALFDRYGYAALFSASVAIARELAVLGKSPDDIELEPAQDVQRLVAEAQELFREGMTTCDLGYSGTSSDPADHVVRCEELLGRCTTLISAERGEEELLDELLAALGAYKPLKKLKGLEELAAQLAVAKDDLCGRTAAAVVAPYAAILKALVSAFAETYDECKRDAGVLDFDDLQVKAVRLLERSPELARRYRDRFRVVMIDEFQDTDALQLRLVEALSDGDLCTVGDEKQSIYRFRGADIDVYRTHRKRMEQDGALVAELDVNYRSHPDLLGFVNGVFGSDEYFGGELLRLRPPPGARPAAGLDSMVGASPRIEAVFIDDSGTSGPLARRVEAAVVAQRLAELCRGGAAPSDIAVLLRSYSHAHDYAEALSRDGIPAVVVGGSRFFELPEIAIMRALNRAIANFEDGGAMGVLLASDFVPLTSDALAILRLGSHERRSSSLWKLLREGSVGLGEQDREAAGRLVSVLERASRRVGRKPLADVLLLAVEEAGWDLRLLSAGNVGRDAFANVLKFVRQASAFEELVGTGTAGFAMHLDAKERLGDSEAPASLADDNSEAVRIMSIHASKGLEFPIVVVPELGARGGSDNLSVRTSRRGSSLAVAVKTPTDGGGDLRPASTWFAEFSEKDSQADAEESARVLYVAFTRAREVLLVSGSMGLRTQKRSTAKHDAARLSRVLGVQTPVTGPSDLIVSVPRTNVACRVRVVCAADVGAPPEVNAGGQEGVVLPAEAGVPYEDFRAPLMLERLSYTQFSEFEHCPKNFWVRRVLGVRPVAVPDRGKADPMRFGNALHASLRLVSPAGEPPPPERVAAISRYFELAEGDSARLSDAVRRYCESDVGRRAHAGEAVRRESPFTMWIGDRFLLTGSIDLYSRTGNSALVLDYKSGETGEVAELQNRYRLQAKCYALAVLRDGCTSAVIEFVRPEVGLADGAVQTTSFSFVADDAAKIELRLLRRYDSIKTSAFDPTPSNDCFHCEVPSGLCPHVRTGARTSGG